MIVFYHRADLDGIGSAALIFNKIKDQISDVTKSTEFIGLDYGDDLMQCLQKAKDQDVVMVDFTFEPEETMNELMSTCSYLVWIDHHKTSQEFVQTHEIPGNVKAIIGDNSISAVEMVWKHYYSEDVPKFVDYLSKFDSWHHNNDKDILAFQLGMKNKAKAYSSSVWAELINEATSKSSTLMNSIISDGRVIQDYVDATNKSVAIDFSYPLEFEGLKFLVLNSSLKSSLVFKDHPDRNKYDGGIIYVRTSNKNWKVSLYRFRDDLDLTPIAKKYKGGGHAGACGFTCDVLPFE